MKAICIDSSNKPTKVPIEQWIKEGEVYTIIKVVKMGLQDGKYGVLLKEVQISADCFPYEYYDAERFIPLDIRLHQAEEEKEEVLEEEAEAEAEAEIYSESRGMETASADDEMIALTTVDGTEPPTQTLREPAITSINRLAAYAALDRGAIAPLGNSANSSDSGLGNPASGMPTPIQTIRPQAATASSQATTLFKSLAPELDKFKQTGSSQIQLDLPVGDQESVRIKLSLRGGEIRSTFITESPELREALQKAWPDFSQNSRDRGYRLGDPAFQQGFQENNANLGENNRRQPDNRTYETGEAFATTSLRKVTSNRSTTSQSPSTALWA